MTAALAFLLAVEAGWVTGLGGRAETNAAGEVVALDLRGTWVTDTDLKAVAALPRLERLDLSLTRITDLGLLQLKGMTSVRELKLRFAELVTDEGVAAVKAWPRIERLDLRGTKVTDNTLVTLAGKDTITALDIGYAEVTDSGLQHLVKFKGLRELAFGGNKMTDVGLEILRSLPKLTRLDIAGRQRTDSGLWSVGITDLGLDPVATLSELRELNLSGTQISSRGLEKLSRLSRIEKLDLHSCKRVTDAAVATLAGLPALVWADLKDTGMTPAGFAALRKARPSLRIAGDPAVEPKPPFRIELEDKLFRVTRLHANQGEPWTMPPERTAGAVLYVLPAGTVRVGVAPPPPGDVVRVELAGSLPSEVDGKQFGPAQPSAADGYFKLLFEAGPVTAKRISCPSRGNCPAHEGSAVDIQVPGGEVVALKPGAAARFNEAPLPLELVRIEQR